MPGFYEAGQGLAAALRFYSILIEIFLPNPNSNIL